MAQVNNPHDKYFRSAMSNKKVAMDFFDLYLPDKFRKAVNLKSIKLEKTSFVDKKLKEYISDILYSANIEGEPGYLYLLVEHQRKADKLMPFRILEYTCQIMRRDIDNGKKNLPVVIPLVLYNGKIQYPYDRDIFALYSNKKHTELAKKCLCQPFHLIDLFNLSDNELTKQNWSDIMIMLMKHIYSRNIVNVIESLINLLADAAKSNDNYVYTSMKYVFNASEIENDFYDLLPSISSKEGDRAMTLADRIFARGREEGISQGISQGKSEGYQKGIKKAAQNLLSEGIDPNIVSKATGISLEELIELQSTSIVDN